LINSLYNHTRSPVYLHSLSVLGRATL
jgi:hypothetical protein